jgi:hypothetical protein
MESDACTPVVAVVVVDARDHAVLQRHVRAAGDVTRLQRWQRGVPVGGQPVPLPREGVVVVASRRTGEAARLAAFCRRVAAQGRYVALVRWAPAGAARPWPEHPAGVVVDVPPSRRREVLGVVGRAFLSSPAPAPPVLDARGARMAVVRGDLRASAFCKQLGCVGRGRHVLGVAPSPCVGEQPPAWGVLPTEEPPSPTQTWPMVDEQLPVDPRRYVFVDPPDDPKARALAIGRLHRAHGDWRATLAAVEACANGVLDDAGDLLAWLGQGLRPPARLTWATLVARAAPTPPAVSASARAFWRTVDDVRGSRSTVRRAHDLARAAAAQRTDGDAPPRTPAEQALDIGALQVAHGDWRATVAAVEASAFGDVSGANVLLDVLGAVLGERRPLTWGRLAARVQAMGSSSTTSTLDEQPSWVPHPPGHKRGARRYTVTGRRAFWRWVDRALSDVAAVALRETALHRRHPDVHGALVAAGHEEHLKVGLSEQAFWGEGEPDAGP